MSSSPGPMYGAPQTPVPVVMTPEDSASVAPSPAPSSTSTASGYQEPSTPRMYDNPTPTSMMQQPSTPHMAQAPQQQPPQQQYQHQHYPQHYQQQHQLYVSQQQPVYPQSNQPHQVVHVQFTQQHPPPPAQHYQQHHHNQQQQHMQQPQAQQHGYGQQPGPPQQQIMTQPQTHHMQVNNLQQPMLKHPSPQTSPGLGSQQYQQQQQQAQPQQAGQGVMGPPVQQQSQPQGQDQGHQQAPGGQQQQIVQHQQHVSQQQLVPQQPQHVQQQPPQHASQQQQHVPQQAQHVQQQHVSQQTQHGSQPQHVSQQQMMHQQVPQSQANMMQGRPTMQPPPRGYMMQTGPMSHQQPKLFTVRQQPGANQVHLQLIPRQQVPRQPQSRVQIVQQGASPHRQVFIAKQGGQPIVGNHPIPQIPGKSPIYRLVQHQSQPQGMPVALRPGGPVPIRTGGNPQARQGVIQHTVTYPQHQQRAPPSYQQQMVGPQQPGPAWRSQHPQQQHHPHIMQQHNRSIRQPIPQQQQPPQQQYVHHPHHHQQVMQQHPQPQQSHHPQQVQQQQIVGGLPQQAQAAGQQHPQMQQQQPQQQGQPQGQPQQGQPQQGQTGTQSDIAYNVEHIFMENGREVRKMPIEMDGQTIWVECVPEQSQQVKGNGAGAGGVMRAGVGVLPGGAANAAVGVSVRGAVQAGPDAIMMELEGNLDGLEVPGSHQIKPLQKPGLLTKSLTNEQKASIINECVDDHISPVELARRHHISADTIRAWVKKSGKNLPKTYKKVGITPSNAGAKQQYPPQHHAVINGGLKPGMVQQGMGQPQTVFTSAPAGQPVVRCGSGETGVDSPETVVVTTAGSVPPTSNAQTVTAAQTSKRIPGKLALCKHCGNMSDDLAMCSRCRRKMPDDVKIVDDPTFKPKPDSTEDSQKKATLRTMRLPTKNRRKGNPDEPVCIALSSDEEDNDDGTAIIHDDATEVNLDESVSDDGIEESVTDGCQAGQFCSVPCRSVRIGNYKVMPKEKIIITSKGIQIQVPSIHNAMETVTINIFLTDVTKVLAHFGKQMPLLFLCLTPLGCAKARKALKMTSPGSFFLDILSTDETQKKITILPEKLTEENKTILKNHLRGKVVDLESKDANEILVRSSPKEANVLRGKMNLLGGAGDKGKLNSSEVTVMKYCQFPAEGAGTVSVTNEDYTCLEAEQFLNDVIIDFYLKYLQYGKYKSKEEVLEKTHIFTTYFYKRLTTRPCKNKTKHHPVEDDPTLTAAEKRYDRVKKWTKKVNIFDKDFIVVPINEHAHWFVCIICFPGQMGCVRADDGTPCDTPASQTGRTKKKKKKKPITIGSTTIIPLKARDDMRLPLEDDSDRDEAEASEDDMEDELEDSSIEDNNQQTPVKNGTADSQQQSQNKDPATEDGSSSTTGDGPTAADTAPDTNTNDAAAKSAAGGDASGPTASPAASSKSNDRQIGVRQPCILIFDSLAGGSKARTCQTLRDYLTCEWKAKMEGAEPRQFTKAIMPGCSPKVQQQPNFSDCGIYLLQYVESFFRNPILDYTLPITSLKNWFPEEEVKNKRSNIAELIRSLASEQNPGKEFSFPEIQFLNDMDQDDGDTGADEDDSEDGGKGGQQLVTQGHMVRQANNQVKISASSTQMVRLTGTTYSGPGARNITIQQDNRYSLISKKGNQVRVTPISNLPAGVTVTPASLPVGSTPVKIAHPTGVKIISNIGLSNIQLVNRKVSIVTTSGGPQQTTAVSVVGGAAMVDTEVSGGGGPTVLMTSSPSGVGNGGMITTSSGTAVTFSTASIPTAAPTVMVEAGTIIAASTATVPVVSTVTAGGSVLLAAGVEEVAVAAKPQPQHLGVIVQTSPDSTSNGNEQIENGEMEMVEAHDRSPASSAAGPTGSVMVDTTAGSTPAIISSSSSVIPMSQHQQQPISGVSDRELSSMTTTMAVNGQQQLSHPPTSVNQMQLQQQNGQDEASNGGLKRGSSDSGLPVSAASSTDNSNGSASKRFKPSDVVINGLTNGDL